MAETLSLLREPLISEERSLHAITEDIAGPVERRPTGRWWIAFVIALSALGLGAACVTHQIRTGIGTWGLNKTVGWAFDITNFVFWVGIGHAGTLISAILFLFRQKWRTSINRAAEAMTLFAVMCAALFPIIHMGRPWLFAWMFPYPNSRGTLWVNFRSPLLWDVFAISTYFIVSAVFWFVGLVPDLATMRDRSTGVRRTIFSILSLGWTGSNRTWSRYEVVYLLLAGLATPLVVSVHTIVSMDFATSVIPGWHTPIFPPYFVAGAVFSGFAMVLTLMIIARVTMGFTHLITIGHLEKMTKVILVTGGIVGLAYASELFVALYSENPYEAWVFLKNRATGPFAWAYWTMVTCNVIIPQLFWIKKVRTTPALIFAISIVINIGMWFERFVIIVTSIHRDYLPSSWAMYAPTFIEVGTFIGTFGLFFTAFLLFCRFLPAVSIGEVKAVAGYGRRRGHALSDHTGGGAQTDHHAAKEAA